MSDLCIRCKGRGLCGGPCKILASLKKFQPKVKKEFSGSSPPEIFVGHYGYPYVYAGILSPNEFGDTEYLSMPEAWHESKATIQDILSYRSKMIYSRFNLGIKSIKSGKKDKLLSILQQVALASKSADMSFKLKKEPRIEMKIDSYTAIIGNPAPLEKATIDSNLKIEKKVDYLVNDYDVKSAIAVQEMYRAGIQFSNIAKVLSAEMLGMRIQRKLVPTRWAITAADDIISKNLIEKIRSYQQLGEILLFSADYLGNYYNIFLIPGPWAFEVIEASSRGYFNKGEIQNVAMWHDYEFFYGRKKYADSVTGAYYANRLALCEYLEKIKRQASCLILREVREEYWAPCGVGILREVTREAMSKQPQRFSNIEEAMKEAQKRFKLPLDIYRRKSKILRDMKTQTKLSAFY